MGKRQQGSQQRQGIGLGEAIVAQRVLEFLQLGCGSIFSRKLQEPLQVVDDRIQRTVLVIGGAAKLDAGRAFGADLLFELLHQPGFANPWLATQQHDLACTRFGLLPAPLQQRRVLRSRPPAASSPSDRHLKAALRFTLLHDAIQRQRSGDAL